MKEHVKKTSEILSKTKDFEIINKYFEANKLDVKDRVFIIQEVLAIKTSQALDIVLHKYREELSDNLLDKFLDD